MRIGTHLLRTMVAASMLLGTSSWAAGPGAGNSSGTTARPGSKAPVATYGWNYRYCSRIEIAPYGAGGTVVKVWNKDGSWVAAASTTLLPNAYQMMLVRACRDVNAYWGWFVTNTATGYWNTARAF